MKLQQWGRRILRQFPLVSQFAHWRQSATLKKQTAEQIFTEIYSTNGWGGQASLSGTGSDAAQTQRIVDALPAIIASLGIRSMLDIPCGDFHWMKSVDLRDVDYLGGDIVAEMIAKNQQYAASKISFRRLNLLADPLPAVDLIFCRDCLVHFSFDDVFKAVENIVQSGSKYLLTTTFPARQHNRSIATGQWRPLNLQQAPFGFPPPMQSIVEGCTEIEGDFSDKSLGLWRIDDVKACLTSRRG